jgi:hypothetical protein
VVCAEEWSYTLEQSGASNTRLAAATSSARSACSHFHLYVGSAFPPSRKARRRQADLLTVRLNPNAFRKFTDVDMSVLEPDRDRLNDALASLPSRSGDGSRGNRALQRGCCRSARRPGSFQRQPTIGWAAGCSGPLGRIGGGVPGPLPGAVAVWRLRTRSPTARRPQARDGGCCLRDGGHQARGTPTRAASREGEASGVTKTVAKRGSAAVSWPRHERRRWLWRGSSVRGCDERVGPPRPRQDGESERRFSGSPIDGSRSEMACREPSAGAQM